MKHILIGFLLLVVAVSSYSQSNYALFLSSYTNPEVGKKANYYENRAMDFLKDGRFPEAVFYSAIALNSDPKKEQIRGAHKGISEGFQKAFQNLEDEINQSRAKGERFDQEDPDPVMGARFRIYDNYRMAKRIMDELQKIPEDLKKSKSKKTADISFTIKDYSKELLEAEKMLEEGKPIAADLKYKMAEKVFVDKSLESAKKAAGIYKSIRTYVANYKDSHEKYNQAKLLGTTNLAIYPLSESYDTKTYGSLGFTIAEQATAALFNDSKYQYEFFQIITKDKLASILSEQKLNYNEITSGNAKVKGIQSLGKGQLSRIEATYEKPNPSVDEREKEVTTGKEKYVDSDGKTKERDIKTKVKGTFTTYIKTTRIKLSGSLSIIDSQTQDILATKTFESFGFREAYWYRFSGDNRVLSDYEKESINRQEPNYPSFNDPLDQATKDFVSGLVQEINKYAASVGK